MLIIVKIFLRCCHYGFRSDITRAIVGEMTNMVFMVFFLSCNIFYLTFPSCKIFSDLIKTEHSARVVINELSDCHRILTLNSKILMLCPRFLFWFKFLRDTKTVRRLTELKKRQLECPC